MLVRSVRREGQAVAVALEERGVPYRLVGAAAFFQRAEIRDVLAWLRLLADPGDAGAVVRALARPPIELRSVDIARCTRSRGGERSTWSPRSSPPPSRRRSRPRRATASSSSSSSPLGRRGAGHDTARSVRASPDRAPRPAPPAALCRAGRRGRAPPQPRAFRRAGRRLRAPLAPGHAARVRPVHRRRRRSRAARGGGGGRDRARARCR